MERWLLPAVLSSSSRSTSMPGSSRASRALRSIGLDARGDDRKMQQVLHGLAYQTAAAGAARSAGGALRGVARGRDSRRQPVLLIGPTMLMKRSAEHADGLGQAIQQQLAIGARRHAFEQRARLGHEARLAVGMRDVDGLGADA